MLISICNPFSGFVLTAVTLTLGYDNVFWEEFKLHCQLIIFESHLLIVSYPNISQCISTWFQETNYLSLKNWCKVGYTVHLEKWHKERDFCPGGGALRCFRYRVCAAGQGIVFTILAPEPGIVFCKKCSQKGILFSNFCSQTGLQCISLILCSQTGCGLLQFCSQTGVF